MCSNQASPNYPIKECSAPRKCSNDPVRGQRTNMETGNEQRDGQQARHVLLQPSTPAFQAFSKHFPLIKVLGDWMAKITWTVVPRS